MSALWGNESDSEDDGKPGISINKVYANNYDTWRRREVLQKLKNKYGENAEERLNNIGGESSSSEEDDIASEWTEENDKNFLKTLAYLKKKDPAIYDNSVKFFKDVEEGGESKEEKVEKKKKEKPLFLRDYQREHILKKSVELSDGEEDIEAGREELTASPTPVEEERALKESLKSCLKDSDDEGEGWGGLFHKRNKTQQELDKENEDYLEWLNGQREHLQDEKVESELKPLREYWSDPKLEEGEKFLRDYILNKRFMGDEDKDHIPTYEEIVHDSDEDLSADEQTLEEQEVFEHKFNFRFEEPDQEFLKRYPRVMENSLRRKDDRRKLKRSEVRERKEKAKLKKLEEVKQLKALKRKGLEERIQKLKEITGNAQLGFKDEDIEGDFDPSEYDQRMKQLFNEEFYETEQDTVKPVFPDLDEELEIENWDQWDGSRREQNNEMWDNNDLHCEDPGFNMDCDYDPKAKLQQEMIDSTRRLKKRKRQSKFAEALAVQKPVFDPKEKSFDKYVEDFYSLDFEDVIGDLPCRFKYRKVVPNSFGLTVEEILSAEDKELNSWCSLRKAVQYRPETQEMYDVQAYQDRARKEHLKRKYLKSLYTEKETGDSHERKVSEGMFQGQHESAGQKQNNSRVQGVDGSDYSDATQHVRVSGSGEGSKADVQSETPDSSKKRKKKRNKQKYSNVNDSQTANVGGGTSEQNVVLDSVPSNLSPKKRKKHKKNKNSEAGLSQLDMGKVQLAGPAVQRKSGVKHSVLPKKLMSAQRNQEIGISDARLRAYGIRPKKFKNSLKYGKKSGFN